MDFTSIDTVLFDFGGTLDAPGVHWLTRFYQLYAQLGLDVAPERIKEAFYWADEQAELDREQFDVEQADGDVARDHDPFVEDSLEDVGQVAGATPGRDGRASVPIHLHGHSSSAWFRK